MRLTLRTLLAYLDQILDESDAGELERKIQESELATQLVHRIRSVMGQRRLAALDVRAGGLGRDANSVAEYLDNTLPVEQIPDFERVCLESDVHLSEVAACHQILTLVLGEPAAIPEGLKEKIYQWSGRRSEPAETAPGPAPPQAARMMTPPPAASRAPAAPSAPDASTSSAAARSAAEDEVLSELLGSQPRSAAGRSGAASPVRPASGKSAQAWDEDEHWTEAPDYLKRSRPARWKPMAIGALIAFCLAIAALRGMGPLNRTHPLAQRLGLSQADRPPAQPAAQTASADAASSVADRDVTSRTMPGDEAPAVFPPADSDSTLPDLGEDPSRQDEEPTLPDAAATAAENPPSDGRGLADGPLDAGRDAAFDLTPPVNLPPADDGPATAVADDQPAEDRVDIAEPPPADVAVTDPLGDPSETAPRDASAAVPAPDDASSGDQIEASAATEREPSEINATPAPPIPDEGLASDTDGITTQADVSSESAVEGPTLINPLATNRNNSSSLPSVRPGVAPSDSSASPSESSEQPTDPGTAPDAPSPPQTFDVGRFLDTHQVLVKLDPESSGWQRVAVGTQLQVDDVLMSLPTYRAPLVLASGMQVTLIGGTRVEVLELDSESTPNFRLAFGRLSVATFTQSGAKLGLHWAEDHSGVLTLDEISTTIAIELWPQHTPGTDPEAGPPHQVLHIYVTSGNAEWMSEQGPAITISAGQRLTLIDDYPALLRDVEEQPEWIDGRDARTIDLIAARDLSQRLTTDRPVALVLKEEAEHRRVELRSLAVCSLAYIGHFDPLFVALNDARLHSYWLAQYEVLQRVPHLSTELAEAVRQAIVQRHGEEEGAALYRMLWGYSPEQLAAGGADDLFDYLDHPSMDFRIVASELLESITGLQSQYRANAGERDPRRRAAISKWRKMLDDDQIKYDRPPEIMALLDEVAPEQR